MLLGGVIVLLLALLDFVLAADFLALDQGRILVLSGAVFAQWCLLAVVCALAGRNPISGLLASVAVSSVLIIALLSGAALNENLLDAGEPVKSRFWVPMALFVWLLPISAAPLWLARALLGWRIVDDGISATTTLRLADLFSLIGLVAYGVVALRFVLIVVEDKRNIGFADMGVAITAVAIAIVVFVLPSLWWLSRIQARQASSDLFLASMAVFPAALSVVSILADLRGALGNGVEIAIFATQLALFGTFYSGLWIIWRCGFRLATRRSRSSHPPNAVVPTWQGPAAVWLLVLAIVVGISGSRIDRKKQFEIAYPEFLKRVQAFEFRTGGKPSLGFPANTVTDGELKFLVNQTDLYALNMNGNPITDRGLRALRPLTSLKSLGLGQTQVTDDGMAALGWGCPLQILELSETQVTAAGLQRLRSPEQFKTLGLRKCRLGDPACDVLRRFANLGTLELGKTQITDVGLAQLAGLSQLTNLGLSSTAITDAGLAAVPEFSQLMFLDINDTSVTGTGFASWKQPEQLKFLFAEDTKLGDEGLKNVLKFSNLDTLIARRTQVTDAGLAWLSQHPSVKQVYLDETSITDNGLNALLGLPHLLRVSVIDTAVGDDAFRAGILPAGLISLNLEGTHVTDETCRRLANSKTLENLVLARTAVTDEGLKHLAGLPISMLDISNTRVTAQGLMDVTLPSLSMLTVARKQFTSAEMSMFKQRRISVWPRDRIEE